MDRQSEQPTLSLVIPCYDEAATLPLLIQRLEAAYASEGDVEIMLVDNGSSDDTPRIIAGLSGHAFIRSVRVEVNQGYGFGILQGLRATRGKFLGWTHGDMQADPGDGLRALEIIRRPESANVYVKGHRHGRPLADVVFTIGMSLFETILLRTPLWDINAQPNIFPRSFYEMIAPQAPHDFSLDLFFYYAARKHGLELVRFPVRFGERLAGVSHWNVNWAAKRKFIERTMTFSFELRKRTREHAL